eukprot:4908041-Prymnesium_polylepis.1
MIRTRDRVYRALSRTFPLFLVSARAETQVRSIGRGRRRQPRIAPWPMADDVARGRCPATRGPAVPLARGT